jgi:hypothetical protein
MLHSALFCYAGTEKGKENKSMKEHDRETLQKIQRNRLVHGSESL